MSSSWIVRLAIPAGGSFLSYVVKSGGQSQLQTGDVARNRHFRAYPGGFSRRVGRETTRGQKIPSSSRAASVILSGVQGGVMTSLTFALATPSSFSSAATASRRICGPAGQAGEVR